MPTVAITHFRQRAGGNGEPSLDVANQAISVPSMCWLARYWRIQGSTVPRSSPIATAPALAASVARVPAMSR